jgi:peptidoglycan/LPS O-acetylase OafA/YrhL
MRDNLGAGPGFDTMRLTLALAIFCSHSWFTSQGDDGSLWRTPLRPVLLAMVPMFFGLSGFLVTGSAIRTGSLQVFMTFRILRIVPALATEVVLSALILGPFLTVVPLHEYFSSLQFYEYFGNIVGRIRFVLPGMFLHNPLPYFVNINLWTLLPEFICYNVMAGLIISGLLRRVGILTIGLIVLTVAAIVTNVFYEISEQNGGYNIYLWYVPFYYFLVGIAAFCWRDRIPVDARLFGAALIASYALMIRPGLAFVATVPVMYCVLYLGMQRWPRIKLIENGDYSYGVYLYGFPIQQTLVYLFPFFRDWWFLLFAVAAPITLAFAMFSWHVVEKPTLSLKRFVLGKERPLIPQIPSQIRS